MFTVQRVRPAGRTHKKEGPDFSGPSNLGFLRPAYRLEDRFHSAR